jgi:SAM-dependent methyltransferase
VRSLIPDSLRRAHHGLATPSSQTAAEDASTDYELLEVSSLPPLNGWLELAVAERQHAAFAPLMRELQEGAPRQDFATLARAVDATGLSDPLILEVGCGSGWNAEVLEVLLGRPMRYVGTDYSAAMTAVGRRHYPGRQFVIGDATALPFGHASCDIVVAGTCLMHVPDYAAAIANCRRVARRWCIFHTMPVLGKRATTLLRKRAYGAWTVEVIFNERSLLELFEHVGLRSRVVLPSVAYDLAGILGEKTSTKTFVCEIVGS